MRAGTPYCSDQCEVITQVSTIHLRNFAKATMTKGKTSFIAEKMADGSLRGINWPKDEHMTEMSPADRHKAYEKQGYFIAVATAQHMLCNMLHRLQKGQCMRCKTSYHYPVADAWKDHPMEEEYVAGIVCSNSCATLYFAPEHLLFHVKREAEERGPESYTPQLACFGYSKFRLDHKGIEVLTAEEAVSEHDASQYEIHCYTPADIDSELVRRGRLSSAPRNNLPLARRRS
jgi:hypothetical protein